jgi:hypothetical protein
MTDYPFTAEDLDALRAWDTPTICNGLEIVVRERRAIGFTVAPMVVVDRKLPPIVGLARTGMIRAKEPPRGPVAPREGLVRVLRRQRLSNHRSPSGSPRSTRLRRVLGRGPHSCPCGARCSRLRHPGSPTSRQGRPARASDRQCRAPRCDRHDAACAPNITFSRAVKCEKDHTDGGANAGELALAAAPSHRPFAASDFKTGGWGSSRSSPVTLHLIHYSCTGAIHLPIIGAIPGGICSRSLLDQLVHGRAGGLLLVGLARVVGGEVGLRPTENVRHLLLGCPVPGCPSAATLCKAWDVQSGKPASSQRSGTSCRSRLLSRDPIRCGPGASSTQSGSGR